MLHFITEREGPAAAGTEPVVRLVFDKLGGVATLGVDVASSADLAGVVIQRIPLKALSYIQRCSHFSDVEIGRLVIPPRTLRHRQAKRQPLTVEESDRLVRLARVQALTEEVFADREKAGTWLREPLGELSGKTPLDLATTEAGVRVIEEILARIDWGAAA
jgi:putative toxin-antitoxin system antitoxin component (TIGR02293 family)